MTAASRALSVLALADEAGLNRLRAAYDPAPAPIASADASRGVTAGLPPAPPPPAPCLAVSSPSAVPVRALTRCTPNHPTATAFTALPTGRKDHTL